jgi:phosphate transport system protein
MSIFVREHFVQKILDVKLKVLRMGALVENIIDTAVTALKAWNLGTHY